MKGLDDELDGGGNRHVSQYWRLCHRRCAHLHFSPSHIVLALKQSQKDGELGQ
jgi:hypothetical protein